MVETKKLPGDINNNKLNDIQEIYINQKNIKEEENNKIKESDKIINDFFMRQLIQQLNNLIYKFYIFLIFSEFKLV